MLASSVATLQDNSVHGDDDFLSRDLGNNSFLDVVMDGVTGHGGAEASRTLKEALAQAQVSSIDDVEDTIKEVNEEFFQVGGGRFLLTTVSAALFMDGRLHVLGAGDSPLFLVSPDSVQQLAGRIGGFLHVGVARAVGAAAELSNLARADVEVAPGSRLVITTDGLTDNILIDELADLIRRAPSPEEAAREIEGTIVKYIEEGTLPARLGRRFRRDDRTAIFRFFQDPA